MLYSISNEFLTVKVDSLGAELRSVISSQGTEYVWQRDERYWGDASPVLFPYIARLYDNSYTYCGERYSMGIHGFAAQSEFTLESISANSLTMVLENSADSLKQYPFRFKFSISYSLSDSVLAVKYNVKNLDDKLMPYAVGGHPGINVPLWKDTRFEDYYLSFSPDCSPSRISFTEEVFLSGKDEPYPLEDGHIIKLKHTLFDDDAIILKDTSKSISLKCSGSNNSVTMSFDGFDYFGVWHMPHTDAPYVCLEPWTSLPSRQGVIEEFCDKRDMLMLEPGADQEKAWYLSILEV